MEYIYRRIGTTVAALGLLLFYGYSLAYLYAYGYTSFYHIPSQYIAIGLPDIFSALYGVLSPFLALFLTAFIICLGSIYKPSSQRWYYLVVLLFLGGEIALYGLNWKAYIVPLVVVLIAVVVHVGTDFTHHIGFYTETPLLIFLLLVHVMFIILVYDTGRAAAIRQKDYVVIHYNNRDLVIIQPYADTALALPIDKHKKRFYPQLFLISNDVS